MQSRVLPLNSSRIVRWILASVSKSTEAVASLLREESQLEEREGGGGRTRGRRFEYLSRALVRDSLETFLPLTLLSNINQYISREKREGGTYCSVLHPRLEYPK